VAAPVVAKAPVAKPPVVEAAVVLPQVVAKPPVVAKRPLVEDPVVQPVAKTPSGRGSGRRSNPILLGALLVAALGVAYLLSPIGDQSSPTATSRTTHATAPGL